MGPRGIKGNKGEGRPGQQGPPGERGKSLAQLTLKIIVLVCLDVANIACKHDCLHFCDNAVSDLLMSNKTKKKKNYVNQIVIIEFLSHNSSSLCEGDFIQIYSIYCIN